MTSRLTWFVLGAIAAIVCLVVGGAVYIMAGGVSMATSAPQLPFERALARLALHASFRDSVHQKDPLPMDEANLVAGAKLYIEHCSVCHGSPHTPPTAIAKGMFPRPPQLFEQTVTDDPEGETFWKVTNGIRMTGMPGYGKTLSDKERWQVTMLLAHADSLPAPVTASLTGEVTR